ncbi:cytochrome P450 [Actinokineospora sp. PR83]|uniref:cytochrome P450 n=1 Tax=Actinokineospora sp. PR83 TaxID=2884908 RepID=UPI001F1A51B5|nr:cytochrome P450 [Actinokineospora sp. PR83]MCG8918358.1 cytochrome P450 [Actinokineospora sp. PR83]
MPTTTRAAVDIAGVAIAEGESVVIALCAANRDPDRTGAPLLPGGPLAAPLAFAEEHAGAVLGALAGPLRQVGPAVRAGRAPVTRPLTRLPVAR